MWLLTLNFSRRDNWSQTTSAITIISNWLGLVASPCLNPSCKTSISSKERVQPDKFTIVSLGLTSIALAVFLNSTSVRSFLSRQESVLVFSSRSSWFMEKQMRWNFIHMQFLKSPIFSWLHFILRLVMYEFLSLIEQL